MALEEASSSSSSSSDSEVDVPPPPKIQSLDDLPSDDSVSIDDDDDDEESKEEHNNQYEEDDDNDEEEDIPLSERLERQRERGLLHRTQSSRDRKAAALEKAKAALHKNKKNSNNQTKKRNHHHNNNNNDEDSQEKEQPQSLRRTSKKRSKHAPTEASSKRKDSYFGFASSSSSGLSVDVLTHRYKPRDPRVQSLSGHYNEDHFARNYGFVEELRKGEIQTLRNQIAAQKMTGKRGQRRRKQLGMTQENSPAANRKRLEELVAQQRQWEARRLERRAQTAVKQKLKAKVEGRGGDAKAGVYFLKRKDKKRAIAEAKYEQLVAQQKTSGKKDDALSNVDKLLAKRRKKNKSKDTKWMK